jgi:hypothetical protein
MCEDIISLGRLEAVATSKLDDVDYSGKINVGTASGYTVLKKVACRVTCSR